MKVEKKQLLLGFLLISILIILIIICLCSTKEQYLNISKYAYVYLKDGKESELSPVIEIENNGKNPKFKVPSSNYKIIIKRKLDNKDWEKVGELDKQETDFVDKIEQSNPPNIITPPDQCSEGGNIWNAKTDGNGPTCGERYNWVMKNGDKKGWKTVVCNSKNSNANQVCGKCYTGKCSSKPTPPNIITPPDQCSEGGNIWNAKTDGNGPTCGERYNWVMKNGDKKGWETVVCNSKNSNANQVCGKCYTGKCSSKPTPPNIITPSGQCSEKINTNPNTISILNFNLFWWKLFNIEGSGNFFPTFKKYTPYDLCGFQECDSVKRVIRDGGLDCYESWSPGHSIAQAWNPNRFKILDRGYKVITEDSPNQYYGKRYCMWIRVYDKLANKYIFFANLHGPTPVNTGGKPNDRGEYMAQNIINLVTENIKEGDTFFLVGDFNLTSNIKGINILSNKWKNVANEWVDHIFTNGIGVNSTPIVEIIHGSGSDHRGIKLTFTYN